MKNQNKFTEFVTKVTEVTDKNSPAILTGLGVLGLITTGILAYKAGAKAKDVIEEHKEDLKMVKKNDKEAKREVIKETIKDVAPIIAPPVLIGAATIACIIGSNTISAKRITVLSTAYTVAERSIKELQAKTEEVVGDKKVKDIHNAIIKDGVKKNPPDKEGKIYITGNGEVLCKDLYTNTVFKSNAQAIERAILDLSSECLGSYWVSLSDFYDALGIDISKMSDDLGWNNEDLVHGRLPISFTAVLTPDNEPCLGIDYMVYPRTDYRNLM